MKLKKLNVFTQYIVIMQNIRFYRLTVDDSNPAAISTSSDNNIIDVYNSTHLLGNQIWVNNKIITKISRKTKILHFAGIKFRLFCII